jgi:hypothetical protein
MKRTLFVVFMLLPMSAIAADVVALQTQIDLLRKEIMELDKDLMECKQGLKGWTAATAVGAVGTVATGVGVAIQGASLHKIKKEQQESSQTGK